MPNPLNITYSQINAPKKGALIILVDEEKRVAFEIEKIVGKAFVERVMDVRAFKAKKCTFVDSISLEKKGFDQLILLGVGDATKLTSDDWLRLGGSARAALASATHANICLKLANEKLSNQAIIDFITGINLRHYSFDRYKTKNNTDDPKKELKITIQLEDDVNGKAIVERAKSLSESIILARDLVNQPANILNTEEFAKEAQKLKKLGVKVETLNEKDMKKLGMNALLGVAQGSKKPPLLVTMQWNGGHEKEPPIALVGKGVVFDTGGISLKPATNMEDMKGDMGGAAAVTGTLMALASRKAKVNVVGIIGLVENMPDGNAQRPGDIVTSMSGQTIEVINTDAEGRLVLADALWYTKETFKPKFMINLATLTGAILVALGNEHAGMFSNDDELANNLYSAGLNSGEKVWRMPLNDAYDKLVDSKFADMRNSCGRNAGAITAAQFLKRFVGDTAWAHLDIAGTAMNSPANQYNHSFGSGFGVRLLDRLIEEYYEV